MKQSHRILINSTWSCLSLLIDMGIRFFLVKYAIGKLGTEAYAVVVLALSFDGFINLLRVGTAAATTKYVADSNARTDQTQTNEYMSTAVAHGLITGLIALLICVYIAYSPSSFVKLPVELHNEFILTMIVIGITSVVKFLFMPFSGFLGALQRYDLVNGIRMAFRVGGSLLIFLIFSFFQLKPWTYIALYIGSIDAANIIHYFMSKKLSPALRISPRFVKMWALKALLSFAIFTFLGTFFSSSFLEGSKWIITNTLGPKMLTFYSIVVMLNSHISQLLVEIMRVLIPTVSRHHALNDISRLKSIVNRGTRAGTMLVMLMLAAGIPIIPQLLRLWLGNEFIWLAPHIRAVLICSIISLPSICSGQVLIGLGKIKTTAILQGLTAIVGLGVLFIGLWWLKLGFVSTTCALCASMVFKGIIYNIIGCSHIEQNNWEFARDIVRPFVIGVIPVAITYLMSLHIQIGGWFQLIAYASLSAAFLSAIYFLTLKNEDKQLLIEMVQLVKNRFFSQAAARS